MTGVKGHSGKRKDMKVEETALVPVKPKGQAGGVDLRAELNPYMKQLVEEHMALALGEESPGVRLRAIQEAYNRVYGKAPQTISGMGMLGELLRSVRALTRAQQRVEAGGVLEGNYRILSPPAERVARRGAKKKSIVDMTADEIEADTMRRKELARLEKERLSPSGQG